MYSLYVLTYLSPYVLYQAAFTKTFALDIDATPRATQLRLLLSYCEYTKLLSYLHHGDLPYNSTATAMIRKNARARRDFLYRKAILLQNAEVSERRSKLRAALASGRPLDPSIANDKPLRKDFQYDESTQDHIPTRRTRTRRRIPTPFRSGRPPCPYYNVSGPFDKTAGYVSVWSVVPGLKPLTSGAAFSKEIRLLLPTGIRLNRGGTILPELVKSAQSAGLSDIVLLHEHRGQPTGLTLSHLPFGPTVSFSLVSSRLLKNGGWRLISRKHNVVLRHDIPNTIRGTVSESYP
ncbi:hypothetical protein NUW58_g8994 [Xylaria curta]|uniref:Uncharacterized protein n=1 Tax=Xylaria curta TaxID=42375 RepID=A0ACC1N347_9PEZI|nr:hypothetical protein NUW58_g8994 [Xylaria curta]